jgi:hypothetical protein
MLDKSCFQHLKIPPDAHEVIILHFLLCSGVSYAGPFQGSLHRWYLNTSIASMQGQVLEYAPSAAGCSRIF